MSVWWIVGLAWLAATAAAGVLLGRALRRADRRDEDRRLRLGLRPARAAKSASRRWFRTEARGPKDAA